MRREFRIGLVAGLVALLAAAGLYVGLSWAAGGRVTLFPSKTRNWLAGELVQQAIRTQDKRRSVKLLQQAVDLEPQNERAWSGLCVIYGNMKQWDMAADACRHSAELSPSADHYYSLGLACEHLRDYAAAADAYNEAAQLSPSDHTNIERALWMALAAGQYDRAANLGQRYLELCRRSGFDGPVLTNTYQELGFAYLQLGRNDEARSMFSKAFPSWRDFRCTMADGSRRGLALDCFGKDRQSGRTVRSCMGQGCLEGGSPASLSDND